MSFKSFLPTGLSLPKRKSAPGMSYAGTDACGFCSTLMNSCSEMRLSPSSSASPCKFGWCLAMSSILEQSHPDMHLTSCISGVGVSPAANIKKRSPVGHSTEAVKSFTKLTFYFLLDDVPTTPLLMSSHKAFLAKSTSNCSRSMVETVLMASTKTPSSLDLKYQKQFFADPSCGFSSRNVLQTCSWSWSKTFLVFGLGLYNLYTPLPCSSFKQFVSAVFCLCFGYMRNSFPPSIRATCSWPSKIQRGWRAGPTNPSANRLAQQLLGKKHPGTHGIWTPAVWCQEPCESCMMIQGNFLNGTSNSLIRWNSSIPSIPNIHRILPGLEEFPSWSVPLPLSPWIGRRPFREECHDWMSWKPRWTHRWSTIAAPEGNICRSRKEAT